MASPSLSQSSRRRQRSVRVSVAVGLVVLAALVVSGAAVSGSWPAVTLSAGLGVLLGALATRITYAELIHARVAAARDRAAQARGYLELAQRRTAENAAHVGALSARLIERERVLEELASALAQSQAEVAATSRAAGVAATAAAEAASGAALQISELEHEVLVLRSELDGARAAWRRNDSSAV